MNIRSGFMPFVGGGMILIGIQAHFKSSVFHALSVKSPAPLNLANCLFFPLDPIVQPTQGVRRGGLLNGCFMDI